MSLSPRPDHLPDDDAKKGGDALTRFADAFKNAVTPTGGPAGLLLRAAERGDLATVQIQLEAGADVNSRDASGNTALHLAARKDRGEIIAHLAAAGADMRARDDKGLTPLAMAINFGAEQATVVLAERGGYDMTDAADEAYLHRACEKNKGSLVAALLRAGADPHAVLGQNASSPLAIAIRSGKGEAVAALLGSPAVRECLNLPMAGDDAGRTAFQAAAGTLDAALVEKMIALGGHVNRARGDGMTPLLIALASGRPATVAALLAGGADARAPVNGPGPGFLQVRPAPLYFLANLTNVADDLRARMAQALVDAGADANLRDAARGDRPLHALVRTLNGGEMLHVLLRAGADIEARDRRGATPLAAAIESAAINEVANLLSAGAKANAACYEDGRTPLMIAAEAGQKEIMQELLHAGADPRAVDKNGRAVMDYVEAAPRLAPLTKPVLEAALARPAKKSGPRPGGRAA